MKRPALFLFVVLLLLAIALPAWAAENDPPVAPPLQSQLPSQQQGQPAEQPQTPAPQESAPSPPAQSVAPNQSVGTGVSGIDVSAGLPVVTTEQMVNKAQRIAGNIYGAAAGVIPYLALVVIIAGVVLGIFFKAARTLVFMALLALVIVLFAPQIISFVTMILKS